MRIQTNRIIFAMLMSVILTACATHANKDPLEGLNRGVYKFNDTADKAVLKPIAGAYKAVAPSPLRTGVSNFFANLGTVPVFVNDLLQLKVSNAMDDLGRFMINSTLGVGGLVDVASMDNVPKHNEDLGQTLGYWGVGNGPYIVLPFLGPSTLRDATGLVVDTLTVDPVTYLNQPATRMQVISLKYVDKRSQYLPASDLLDEAALDPYAFMRDSYLQRRANLVADGVAAAPNDNDDDDTPATK